MTEKRKMIPLTAKAPEPAQPVQSEQPEVSLYESVGGTAFFVNLVDDFYSQVEAQPLVRSLYHDDLTQPKADLSQFLAQYWGGPTTYSDTKGHPRLRMRHAPFKIGVEQQVVWLACMQAAVSQSPAGDVEKRALNDYFAMASKQMINWMD
ncbi:MAG: globin [Acidimicrobiales bacterium]